MSLCLYSFRLSQGKDRFIKDEGGRCQFYKHIYSLIMTISLKMSVKMIITMMIMMSYLMKMFVCEDDVIYEDDTVYDDYEDVAYCLDFG